MTPTRRAALAAATGRLAHVTDDPRLEAEWLMAHAAGVSRGTLLMGGGEPVGFDALVERRAAGEPLAYVTGTAPFLDLELAVGPGVLIPRADTELLVEAAMMALVNRPPDRILDLGTGTGALLFAALDHWPDATGLGIDRSPDAVAWAERNRARLGQEERAKLRTGDWLEGVTERFDLILCNPPYVATDDPVGDEVRGWEPADALWAGADGLDDLRRLAATLAPALADGGIAVVEIGWRQGAIAGALFADVGFSVEVRLDHAGRDRALLLRPNPT